MRECLKTKKYHGFLHTGLEVLHLAHHASHIKHSRVVSKGENIFPKIRLVEEVRRWKLGARSQELEERLLQGMSCLLAMTVLPAPDFQLLASKKKLTAES